MVVLRSFTLTIEVDEREYDNATPHIRAEVDTIARGNDGADFARHIETFLPRTYGVGTPLPYMRAKVTPNIT